MPSVEVALPGYLVFAAPTTTTKVSPSQSFRGDRSLDHENVEQDLLRYFCWFFLPLLLPLPSFSRLPHFPAWLLFCPTAHSLSLPAPAYAPAPAPVPDPRPTRQGSCQTAWTWRPTWTCPCSKPIYASSEGCYRHTCLPRTPSWGSTAAVSGSAAEAWAGRE